MSDAASDGGAGPADWAPDRRTIEWISGILHEERIVDTLRAEVADRNLSEVGSDEYWRLVASIAVEHITVDVIRMARQWGTDFAG